MSKLNNNAKNKIEGKQMSQEDCFFFFFSLMYVESITLWCPAPI